MRIPLTLAALAAAVLAAPPALAGDCGCNGGHQRRGALISVDANAGGHRGLADVDANIRGLADLDVNVGHGRRGGGLLDLDVNAGRRGSLLTVDANVGHRVRRGSAAEVDVRAFSGGVGH